MLRHGKIILMHDFRDYRHVVADFRANLYPMPAIFKTRKRKTEEKKKEKIGCHKLCICQTVVMNRLWTGYGQVMNRL